MSDAIKRPFEDGFAPDTPMPARRRPGEQECDGCEKRELVLPVGDEVLCLTCIVERTRLDERENGETYTREQLTTGPALHALYEHFGIAAPEVPNPSPVVADRLRAGVNAACDAIDKGKGGEDV